MSSQFISFLYYLYEFCIIEFLFMLLMLVLLFSYFLDFLSDFQDLWLIKNFQESLWFSRFLRIFKNFSTELENFGDSQEFFQEFQEFWGFCWIFSYPAKLRIGVIFKIFADFFKILDTVFVFTPVLNETISIVPY